MDENQISEVSIEEANETSMFNFNSISRNLIEVKETPVNKTKNRTKLIKETKKL